MLWKPIRMNVEISRINKKSEEKATQVRESGTAITEEEMHELSKEFPYYGYIDIEIDGAEPFVMLSNNDDVVARNYLWAGRNAYEKTSLKLWVALAKKSPTVLDVGSYTGVFSLAAAKSNRTAKVLAFEALDRVYYRLILNKQVNAAGNLQVFNRAVSDTQGKLEFNVYSGDTVLVTGSSLIEKNIDRPVYEKKTVATICLDEFIAELGMSRVGLIKIDAEGAEHLVLKGAKHIIEASKPDILVELLKDAQLQNIESMLAPLGYKYYQLNDATGEIKHVDSLIASTSMHDLNTLISCKTLQQLEDLLK